MKWKPNHGQLCTGGRYSVSFKWRRGEERWLSSWLIPRRRSPLPSLSPEAAHAQMIVVHSETFKVVSMPEGIFLGEGVIWKFVLRLFRACSKWLTAKILKTIQANKNTQAKPIKTHQ